MILYVHLYHFNTLVDNFESSPKSDFWHQDVLYQTGNMSWKVDQRWSSLELKTFHSFLVMYQGTNLNLQIVPESFLGFHVAWATLCDVANPQLQWGFSCEICPETVKSMRIHKVMG